MEEEEEEEQEVGGGGGRYRVRRCFLLFVVLDYGGFVERERERRRKLWLVDWRIKVEAFAADVCRESQGRGGWRGG